VYLAITHYYAGDCNQAMALAAASLRLAERTGNRPGPAFADHFLGSCAKATGSSARGRGPPRAAMAINHLGNLAQARGDCAAAQRHDQVRSDLSKEVSTSTERLPRWPTPGGWRSARARLTKPAAC
jgi:hypothetical protein